ncbi:hypothetical protein GCK72_013838 [Caenorhabditis remanei]|uniref:Serpentine receptor class gamma n=1 Tax=Caenorhabditis remanei TaxID=31234 RepID=A0A6A5GSP9_CAERE|nr:hypothetical protein GCK72_013838 [Caenorhabditis remanei]KAF1757382.1 hypothetical protein GCK72_013838 [Caenorhabditis remanei]
MFVISKIWLGYGLISVVLSAFLVLIISTSQLFNQSFYRLVTIHLVLVILSWINSWPSRIVYTEDSPYFARVLFEHSPRLFKSFTFLGVAFCHIQSWSSIVICINKLRTANPEKYEERNKFWNRWCLLIYGLIIAFGLLAANYLIVIPTIRYLPETGNFVFIVMNLGDGIMNIFLVGVFLILYILISLIIGLITICKIRKHEEKGYHHSSLVILAHTFFRVFCLLSLMGSFFLQIEDFTVEMMITIVDFMTFSMTYMLLFCDENVKMAFRTSCSSGDST